MTIIYKGVTTKKLYQFMSSAVPAVLLSSTGGFVSKGTFNGETVILANSDGSVQRGVAAGPPAGASTIPAGKSGGVDIYSSYTTPSLWESS